MDREQIPIAFLEPVFVGLAELRLREAQRQGEPPERPTRANLEARKQTNDGVSTV